LRDLDTSLEGGLGDGLGSNLGDGLDVGLADTGALAADLGVEVAVFGKDEGSCLWLPPRDGERPEALPDKA
jgi:hypothetical protein